MRRDVPLPARPFRAVTDPKHAGVERVVFNSRPARGEGRVNYTPVCFRELPEPYDAYDVQELFREPPAGRRGEGISLSAREPPESTCAAYCADGESCTSEHARWGCEATCAQERCVSGVPQHQLFGKGHHSAKARK
jgi:hypothetical protein